MVDQLLTELPHALTHDLGARLRQIRSFHQLLDGHLQGLDDESRKWLDFIGQGSELGQAMIARLTEWLAIGFAAPACRTLSLQQLAALTEEVLDGQCRLTVTDDVPVQVDPALWSTLIRELGANAREHGMTPQPRITLTSAPDRIHLHVADDGPGIEIEQWAVATRPFGRLGPYPCPSHVGMGLPLAKLIAAVHHGALHRVDDGQPGLHLSCELPTSIDGLRAGSTPPVVQ